MVAVLVGDVGDDLDPAVGERDAVLALGLVAVPHLVVREVVAGVVVLHAVPEGVVARALKKQESRRLGCVIHTTREANFRLAVKVQAHASRLANFSFLLYCGLLQ